MSVDNMHERALSNGQVVAGHWHPLQPVEAIALDIEGSRCRVAWELEQNDCAKGMIS